MKPSKILKKYGGDFWLKDNPGTLWYFGDDAERALGMKLVSITTEWLQKQLRDCMLDYFSDNLILSVELSSGELMINAYLDIEIDGGGLQLKVPFSEAIDFSYGDSIAEGDMKVITPLIAAVRKILGKIEKEVPTCATAHDGSNGE